MHYFVHCNCTLKFCSVKFKVKNVENLIAYLRLCMLSSKNLPIMPAYYAQSLPIMLALHILNALAELEGRQKRERPPICPPVGRNTLPSKETKLEERQKRKRSPIHPPAGKRPPVGTKMLYHQKRLN